MNIARSVATVGQLREVLAPLPDDTRIVIIASVITDDGTPDTVSGSITQVVYRDPAKTARTAPGRVVICT
jgi:hypothetical protein